MDHSWQSSKSGRHTESLLNHFDLQVDIPDIFILIPLFISHITGCLRFLTVIERLTSDLWSEFSQVLGSNKLEFETTTIRDIGGTVYCQGTLDLQEAFCCKLKFETTTVEGVGGTLIEICRKPSVAGQGISENKVISDFQVFHQVSARTSALELSTEGSLQI
ncbi:hypothetical protein PoB_006819500 [Plakobranchus ocellatus]|uniref:Uncharacterized protein n=1 Tax=Plakobranchus ocellatus TaxID=259542 RepID=A0AAV4DCB4_9GAST|nr:hypothetical protein PoB_006819500 [Plakobranchus ocellatus]